jgi:hypothetical protein
MFNLENICPDINDPDNIEMLEGEGTRLEFDTRGILGKLELEQLTSEEIFEVRSNLCLANAWVQMKRFVLDPKFCTIVVYRIIIMKNKTHMYGTTNMHLTN